MRSCRVDDCHRPHYGRDLCRFHYDRMRWRGTTDAPPGLVQNKGRQCATAECERPASGKGYCDGHYRRLLKFGDPTLGGPIRLRRDQSLVPEGHRWCPPCDRILLLDQFSKNQRQCRECQRARYDANPAKVRAINSASNRRTYERAKAEGRCAWRGGRGCTEPPESGYIYCAPHRVRDAARHSREYARHYAAHGLDSCWLCTGAFTDDDAAEHDHLIPKSLGGPDDPWNRAPAHRSCNNRRRNMPLVETVARWHPDGLVGPIADVVAAALNRAPEYSAPPAEVTPVT